MESKVIVDNTTYTINGGKSCVDGTIYDVSKGKSMIEGATHDTWAIRVAKVNIVKSPRIMLDSQAAAPCATVSINSEVYNNSSTESLRVPLSNIAYCYVEKTFSANASAAWIKHNGNPVRKLEEAGKATYEHVITTDTTFVIYAGGASGMYEGSVHIYDDGYIMFSYNTSELIAREGMTWEEWVNSELSESTSFVIKDGFVYATETATNPIGASLSRPVKATDTITRNRVYLQ